MNYSNHCFTVELNFVLFEVMINKINKQDEQIQTLKKLVIHRSFEVEKLQQYINRDVIKICGIKEPTGLGAQEHENTNDTVKEVLSAADIPITDKDISITHLLPSKIQ